MNNRWNDQKVETILGATVKRPSESFNDAAETMFASFETEMTSKEKPAPFPSKWWISTAAAAVVILGVISINVFNSQTSPQTEDMSYEHLVAMDEALKNGLGTLNEENLEALQSISWMIENS